MRIAVTGGAGFIGSNLVRRLVQHGRTVVVLDDLSTGDPTNLSDYELAGGARPELIVGSILDRDTLDEAFVGVDAVIHLAARPSVPRSITDPLTTHHVNATGTLEVLEAVRRAGKPYLIVASSSSVYGANPILPKREVMELRPTSPYAASKLAAESYALAHAACYQLPVLAFRFFNVYGPNQTSGHPYAAVIPAFISAALRNGPLTIYGDGYQTRDFTFVGTVVDVLCSALEHQVACASPVNLAFGTRASLLDVATILEETVGLPLPRNHVPARAGDVRDSQADITLFQSLFTEARSVSLREGLAATVEWHRKQRLLSPSSADVT